MRLLPPSLQLSRIDGWEREEAGSDGGDNPTAMATPDLVRNFLLAEKSVAQNATTDPSEGTFSHSPSILFFFCYRKSMVEDPFEIYWIIVVVFFFLIMCFLIAGTRVAILR